MPPRHSKKENGFVVVQPGSDVPAEKPSTEPAKSSPASPSPPVASSPPESSPPKPPSEKQRARINHFLKSLPDQVEATKELAWVRIHPAMQRRAEGAKGSGHIEITIEDIKRPPHGPAPSKSAVTLLKHHAQNPLKFFDEDLKVQHKRASVEEGMDDDAEELEFLDDLKMVDAMIREATKNTRVKHEVGRSAKA